MFQNSIRRLIVETHLAGDALAAALTRLNKLGAYNWYCSEAVESQNSEAGTYGGALAGASKHISQLPLRGYQERAAPFWSSSDLHLVGFQIQVRGGAGQVFGGYNRGGPDPRIFGELLRRTNSGCSPLILFGDFSARPDDSVILDWATRLPA